MKVLLLSCIITSAFAGTIEIDVTSEGRISSLKIFMLKDDAEKKLTHSWRLEKSTDFLSHAIELRIYDGNIPLVKRTEPVDEHALKKLLMVYLSDGNASPDVLFRELLRGRE